MMYRISALEVSFFQSQARGPWPWISSSKTEDPYFFSWCLSEFVVFLRISRVEAVCNWRRWGGTSQEECSQTDAEGVATYGEYPYVSRSRRRVACCHRWGWLMYVRGSKMVMKVFGARIGRIGFVYRKTGLSANSLHYTTTSLSCIGCDQGHSNLSCVPRLRIWWNGMVI